MVMHARSGGNLEVMGLMLGKVDGETMIIMDSFALPVEGTETRVNAQAAAYEYMAAYIENAKQVRGGGRECFSPRGEEAADLVIAQEHAVGLAGFPAAPPPAVGNWLSSFFSNVAKRTCVSSEEHRLL